MVFSCPTWNPIRNSCKKHLPKRVPQLSQAKYPSALCSSTKARSSLALATALSATATPPPTPKSSFFVKPPVFSGTIASPAPRCTLPLRSEEHTSELQSPDHLVCRLLLEKKKKHRQHRQVTYNT